VYDTERVADLHSEGDRFECRMDGTPAVLSLFGTFRQLLQANAWTLPQIRPRPFPSTPCPFNCLLNHVIERYTAWSADSIVK
jgi:hypothetical protein